MVSASSGIGAPSGKQCAEVFKPPAFNLDQTACVMETISFQDGVEDPKRSGDLPARHQCQPQRREDQKAGAPGLITRFKHLGIRLCDSTQAALGLTAVCHFALPACGRFDKRSAWHADPVLPTFSAIPAGESDKAPNAVFAVIWSPSNG